MQTIWDNPAICKCALHINQLRRLAAYCSSADSTKKPTFYNPNKHAEAKEGENPEKTEKPKDHNCPTCIPESKTKEQLVRPKDPIVEEKTIRWGIVPVSRIADDFCTALSVLPKGHHKVTACVACYRSQLDGFAKKHKIKRSFTNIYDFAKYKEIDVVYVSAPNPLHLELSRLMMDNGKHVLCEMPLCMNASQVVQIVGHAHAKRCFLMEAMWPRFLPAYQSMRKELRECGLGELHEVTCTYSQPLLNTERVIKRHLGGGVTTSLGLYAIQLAQWAFRMQPYKINASGTLNESGVDISAEIELNYGCERRANISLNACEEGKNEAIVRGSKSTLTIPEFWCPTKFIYAEGEELVFELPETKLATNYPKRIGLCYEAEEVRRCLLCKKNQSELLNHNESLMISRIVDEIRKQLGVTYDEDQSVDTCR